MDASLARRSLFLVAVCCLLAACGHASPPARSRAALIQPHRIVVFGDSLALGYGASDPAKGFLFVLFRRVQQRDANAIITNYAVGGARIEDVVNVELGRAQAEPATDVWLCVGGNDVTHGTPASRFASDYRAALDSVRRRWPRAKIIAFGVPDVSRSPLFVGSTRVGLHALAAADDQAAKSAASKSGAGFVDLFSLGSRIVGARDFSADNFHPSDAGYATLAAFAEPTVLRTAFGDR